jgi:quercetin dioxygenase-like cupin family protein
VPYVDPSEALDRTAIDLHALARELGPGTWRQPLVADGASRWVLLAWEPGTSMVPHRHPGAGEVFLVVEGRLGLRLGDEPEIEAGPGTLLHARPDELHALRVIGDDRLVLIASVAPNEARPDETIELPDPSEAVR